MKRFCLIVTLSLLLSGCDTLYSFVVWNKSCYPIIVMSEQFDNLEATYNPQHSKHPGSSFQMAFPDECVSIHSWSKWENEPSHQDSGYIKIYIMDTLTRKDTLCIYYMEEWSVKKCNSRVSFPPSEDMKDFKMWPPYGTYDVYGNRVD